VLDFNQIYNIVHNAKNRCIASTYQLLRGNISPNISIYDTDKQT